MSSEQQRRYMRLCMDEARKSPPKPTNFCVGACLINPVHPEGELLVSGYTLECPGNTHAEQSCFIKLAERLRCTDDTLGEHLPAGAELYTTMEPCNKRSPGNTPCVDRILGLKTSDGKQAIRIIYVGVAEPETFVGLNEGKQKLLDAGIEVIHVPGFEDEILAIATAGHGQS